MAFLLLLVSCSESAKGGEIAAPVNETPKILQEKKSYRDDLKSSLKKGSRSNLVEQLYAEALANDPALKALNKEVSEMHQETEDSLKTYHQYLKNVNDYWTSVDRYINYLSDSTLQKATREYFDILENRHNERLLPHKILEDSINAKGLILHNQHVLVKLITSARMMENYQNNEMPSLETFQKVNQKYQKLIDETQSLITPNEN